MNNKYYLKFWISGLRNSEVVNERYKSIFEVDYAKLKSSGIKLIVFDFDDTLAFFHADNLSPDVTDLLNKISKDFSIAIFSNCSESRNKVMQRIFSDFNFYNEERSDKPNPRGYELISKRFNVDVIQSAMIGDRIATDLWGAYLAGYKKCILVEPFSTIFGGRKARFIDRILKSIEKTLFFL